MFNDKVKITISSGKGGDGAIAFRHENTSNMAAHQVVMVAKAVQFIL